MEEEWVRHLGRHQFKLHHSECRQCACRELHGRCIRWLPAFADHIHGSGPDCELRPEYHGTECPGFTGRGLCEGTAIFNVGVTGTPTPSLVYSINGTPITPSYSFPTGVTTVTATATNTCGTDVKNFTVTINDSYNPVASAKDITVQLDATGNASITGTQVDNGSTDNCGIAT